MQTKTYTPEFRAEAVKLVLAQRLSLEEAAQRIAMPKAALANWVSRAKRGNAGTVMPGSRTVPELEAEVATQVPTFTGFPLGVTSATYNRSFNTLDSST